MSIHALNWYHITCQDCDTAIDIQLVSPVTIDDMAQNLHELHWLVDTTVGELRVMTPTWCPFHGPDLDTR